MSTCYVSTIKIKIVLQTQKLTLENNEVRSASRAAFLVSFNTYCYRAGVENRVETQNFFPVNTHATAYLHSIILVQVTKTRHSQKGNAYFIK